MVLLDLYSLSGPQTAAELMPRRHVDIRVLLHFCVKTNVLVFITAGVI